jgi:phytoene/squalene synthetase
MTDAAPDAAAHFVAKWQRREPEMALAEVFCAPADRARLRAWGALVHELREAAFELSDPKVTTLKCQWWAEELVGLAQGRSRHPVTGALALPSLPWTPLARALLEQAHYDSRPADLHRALADVSPMAQAIAALESGLFQAQGAPADAVAVNLLLHRLPEGLQAPDQARLPMNLLARHGLTAAQVAAGEGEKLLRDWAAELRAALPVTTPGQCLFRRLRTGFDEGRLKRLSSGRGFNAPSAPASLWRAWRLARST